MMDVNKAFEETFDLEGTLEFQKMLEEETKKATKKFDIKDTVDLMLSNDYRDRLRAEYLQLGYRIKKSVNYAISGNFSDSNYDFSIYSQIRGMLEYFENLEERLLTNDIDLEDLKNMLKEI